VLGAAFLIHDAVLTASCKREAAARQALGLAG
jgi:hypothetical protein